MRVPEEVWQLRLQNLRGEHPTVRVPEVCKDATAKLAGGVSNRARADDDVAAKTAYSLEAQTSSSSHEFGDAPGAHRDLFTPSDEPQSVAAVERANSVAS